MATTDASPRHDRGWHTPPRARIEHTSRIPGLTLREQEIVLLLGEGVSNKEIARRLSIRVATVKNHVHSILQKLGVSRRFAVAALLMRHRENG